MARGDFQNRQTVGWAENRSDIRPWRGFYRATALCVNANITQPGAAGSSIRQSKDVGHA